MTGELSESEFREKQLVPSHVRLILLGVKREEANAISTEWIDRIVGLRKSGQCQADAILHLQYSEVDIRLLGNIPQERREQVEAAWIEDRKLLAPLKGDLPILEEASAFGEGGANPFRETLGPTDERTELLRLPTPTSTPYKNFTRPAVEATTGHVADLLQRAKHLISLVQRREMVESELTDHAAVILDKFRLELRSNWASVPLLEELHRINPSNYSAGGIVRASAHEALEELAQKVYFAFREAIYSVAFQEHLERDRGVYGPWHGQEVRAALAVVETNYPQLVAAFGSMKYQEHLSDLERESARLLHEAGLAEHSRIPGGKRSILPQRASADQIALYQAICALKPTLRTEGKIISFIESPDGKMIREMIAGELRERPKTRGKNARLRTTKDVVRAALKPTYFKVSSRPS